MLGVQGGPVATHYRHTQVGWVMIGSLTAALVLVVPLVPFSGVPVAARVALAVVALAFVVFSSLTTEVDQHEVRLHYTTGLVRRRVALAEVRRCRTVRNSWLHGWGIRRLRNGWMWNVSGLDAVELEWRDGSVFRIGTDEPQALAHAIQQAAPGLGGTPASREEPRATGGPRTALIAAVLVLVGTVAFVTPFYLQTRPPVLTLGEDALRVDSLFYGDTYPLAAMSEVSLLQRLPRAQRTNGFAGAGLLRGRFRVEGLGEGKLFVDSGAPPFLLIKLERSFVIVSAAEPNETVALYDRLRQRLASR
jgi:hypothetical protein